MTKTVEIPIADVPEAFTAAQFLQKEIERLGYPLRIAPEASQLSGRYLTVPAGPTKEALSNNVEKFVHMLGDIEDAWNDQEPEPELRVVLMPMGRPSN